MKFKIDQFVLFDLNVFSDVPIESYILLKAAVGWNAIFPTYYVIY